MGRSHFFKGPVLTNNYKNSPLKEIQERKY